MRNTQEIKDFLSFWKGKSLPDLDLLEEYQGICTNLLYEDEETLLEVTSLLRKNIEAWAYKKSKAYSKLTNNNFIEKKDLIDKKSWFVEEIPYSSMSTSGTTTGNYFEYRRCKDYLYFLECDNHYDLIMDEFKIKSEPHVLLFINIGHKNTSDTIEIIDNPSNFMDKHGIKRRCKVHYLNFTEFRYDKIGFFEKLINHLNNYEIDVTLTTGSYLSSLCNYLKDNNLKTKISKLLSNTNEMLQPESIKYIKENRTFDEICDHMRCWDGGATFFTCREENYHLMDNISWCVEKDKKLISTDYFSTASPFVNYWNGDLCKISNKFSRCDCGRLYRDFEFLENRPFLIKGKSVEDIKKGLSKWNKIKEIRCLGCSLELVSSSLLEEKDKQEISIEINKILSWEQGTPSIRIKFSLEDYG